MRRNNKNSNDNDDCGSKNNNNNNHGNYNHCNSDRINNNEHGLGVGGWVGGIYLNNMKYMKKCFGELSAVCARISFRSLSF